MLFQRGGPKLIYKPNLLFPHSHSPPRKHTRDKMPPQSMIQWKHSLSHTHTHERTHARTGRKGGWGWGIVVVAACSVSSVDSSHTLNTDVCRSARGEKRRLKNKAGAEEEEEAEEKKEVWNQRKLRKWDPAEEEEIAINGSGMPKRIMEAPQLPPGGAFTSPAPGCREIPLSRRFYFPCCSNAAAAATQEGKERLGKNKRRTRGKSGWHFVACLQIICPFLCSSPCQPPGHGGWR